MRAATENSFARVLNPHGGAYKDCDIEKNEEIWIFEAKKISVMNP